MKRGRRETAVESASTRSNGIVTVAADAWTECEQQKQSSGMGAAGGCVPGRSAPADVSCDAVAAASERSVAQSWMFARSAPVQTNSATTTARTKLPRNARSTLGQYTIRPSPATFAASGLAPGPVRCT